VDNYDWKVVDRFDLKELPNSQIHEFPWPALFSDSGNSAFYAQSQAKQKPLIRLRNLEIKSIAEMIRDKRVTTATTALMQDVLSELGYIKDFTLNSASELNIDGVTSALYVAFGALVNSTSDLSNAYKEGVTALRL